MTLFDGRRAVARSWRSHDPDTSHEAARSISRDVLNAGQRAVLNTFRLARRPLTDDQLLVEVRRHFPQTRLTDSSIRTRRRELQRRGQIVLVGYSTTLSGRRCMKFEIAGGDR